MKVTALQPRMTDPVERMYRARAQMAAASADLLEAIWDIDEQALWKRQGATSLSAWLAARLGLTKASAREWVLVAHALRELPKLFRAYARGWVSWDQLRPAVRLADAESDEDCARRAGRLRPATLWREVKRRQRVRSNDEAEVRRRRFLSLWWDQESPALYLSGMLPAEEGAAVEAALARRSEEVVLADQPEDPADARMADALVELVAGSAEATDRAPAPTVVVHAQAEVLAGRESPEGPWLAETEEGHRLSAEAVRRLACDANVEWVLEGDGRPVGIGRRGRTVPGQIARLLRHRDGGACRFPGCERRRWLQAHHLVHWARGGGTNLDNLVLVCWHHHRLLHEGGWGTSGHPGTELRFHDPTGRPLISGLGANAPPVQAAR